MSFYASAVRTCACICRLYISCLHRVIISRLLFFVLKNKRVVQNIIYIYIIHYIIYYTNVYIFFYL